MFGASVTSTRKVLGSPQEIIFIGKNADNHRIPGYPRIIWVTSVKLGIAKQPSASMQPNQWTVGKNTLLRVIPTMTFIRFVTGKSSGILSDISSGILSSISSGILSGISSGISSGILSVFFFAALPCYDDMSKAEARRRHSQTFLLC